MKHFFVIIFLMSAGFWISCNTSNKPAPALVADKDAVLRSLENEINKYPDSIVLVDRMIDTLTNRGDYDAAATWCDSLVNRDSAQYFIYRLVKADIYRGGKMYAKAISAYQSYLQVKPEESMVFLSLANTMAEAGDTATPQFCDAVWKRFPTPETRVGLYYIKGIYYNTIKQYPTARRWLDSTIRYDYSFTDAYMEKGYAWFDEGNYKNAAITFEKLVEVDPRNADGWYWLGKSRETLKQTPAAIEAYRRCLMINDQIIEAQAGIDRLSKNKN